MTYRPNCVFSAERACFLTKPRGLAFLLGIVALGALVAGCSDSKGHVSDEPIGGAGGQGGVSSEPRYTGGLSSTGGVTATGGASQGGQAGSSSSTEPQAPVYCNEEKFPTVEALLADAALRGRDARPEMVSYTFSQSGPSSIDPQLEAMVPTVSIRTTNQWGTDGTLPSQYAKDSIKQLQDKGARVILGLTASVVFETQFASHAEFLDAVTRDASNQPVLHSEIVPNAYRGNLASPRFRELVVKNAKTLIDVGADGIFFDEANAGYSGAKYDSNEGFDEYHELDFRRYLCDKYPGLSPSEFAGKLGLTTKNTVDCSVPFCTRSGFSVRAYLEEKGLTQKLANVDPRLAVEWGAPTNNRCVAAPQTFTETYNTIYWADIVRRVRAYARDTYGREVLITSNGLFPFVDFQSVGLYPYNVDGDTRKEVKYVPTDTSGKLDGKASMLTVFAKLRTQSEAVAGSVPVVLFIDWPTAMMDAYYAFSEQEKKDYFRIFGAEAYASGLRFAWHLKTSMPADPTATKSGMLDWFAKEGAFYRANAERYIGARASTATVKVDVESIASSVTEVPSGARVVHLINHQYEGGFAARTDLSVEVTTTSTKTEATLISPDLAASTTVTLSCDTAVCRFKLPSLTSYALVVIE